MYGKTEHHYSIMAQSVKLNERQPWVESPTDVAAVLEINKTYYAKTINNGL